MSKVGYKKNQHVLSQWVLRNFRSDDTAGENKGKQRVWCHTVYFSSDKKNDIKDMPLPISSVGVSKNCFSLRDADGIFDLEDEISEYEWRTSVLFNRLIHEGEFGLLVDVVNGRCCAIDTILNFILIQLVLSGRNPQNKNDDRDFLEDALSVRVLNNIGAIVDLLRAPPLNLEGCIEPIYRKMLRVVESQSSDKDRSRALVILFMLAESKGLKVPICFLDELKNEIFLGLRVTDIYHTGYEFNSVELRPVFVTGPGIFVIFDGRVYVPLAHNLAVCFSRVDRGVGELDLNIYSTDFSRLKLNERDERLNLYKVSHDFIDGISTILSLGFMAQTNTIYTPFELSDIERYLDLQDEKEEFYSCPVEPLLIARGD